MPKLLDITTPEESAAYFAKIASKALKPVKKKRHKKPINKLLMAPKGFKVPKVETEMTLALLGSHNVNGQMYGPGTVKVAMALGGTLREMEQRARQYDETWRDERAVLVKPSNRGGHRIDRVSPGMFELGIENLDSMGRRITSSESSALKSVTGEKGNTVAFEWGPNGY